MRFIAVSEYVFCFWLLLFWPVDFLPLANLFGQEPEVQKEATPASLFEGLKGSMAFFSLQREGKNLRPVVEGNVGDYEELAAKFREIGGASNSGSTNSNRLWSKHFNGTKLTGKFGSGDLLSLIHI